MQIVKYPHPALRHKSKPLRRVDQGLRDMIAQMFELMYEHRGIGLAANQVDLPYRLFVINLESDTARKESEFVFINPVLSQRSGMVEREEGCLSLPELYAPVRRPEKVAVTAYNLAGVEVTHQFDGLMARAVQHEYDHLDGVLMIDRVSPSALLALKEPLGELEAVFHGDRSLGRIPTDPEIAARLADLENQRC